MKLFAYHRTHTHGEFQHSYYFTTKNRPHVGEILYIISGDKAKNTKNMMYFLEGRYVVRSVESSEGERRKLVLEAKARPPKRLSINAQRWFNNKEFHNIFTSGASMNPVRPEYERRFDELLRPYEKFDAPSHGAFDDSIDDIGSDTPLRVNVSGPRYSRDPNVREAVRQRANGKCEYCGELGFISTNGKPYLECHHIIALADDGADRMTNVVALCPRHHREAHFGERGDELERELMRKMLCISNGK